MADLTNKTQNSSRYPNGYNPFAQNRVKGSIFDGPNINQYPDQNSRRSQQVPGSIVGNVQSPPKATATPVGNNGYMFTGLSEALNTYQNDLAKKKPGYIADI